MGDGRIDNMRRRCHSTTCGRYAFAPRGALGCGWGGFGPRRVKCRQRSRHRTPAHCQCAEGPADGLPCPRTHTHLRHRHFPDSRPSAGRETRRCGQPHARTRAFGDFINRFGSALITGRYTRSYRHSRNLFRIQSPRLSRHSDTPSDPRYPASPPAPDQVIAFPLLQHQFGRPAIWHIVCMWLPDLQARNKGPQ